MHFKKRKRRKRVREESGLLECQRLGSRADVNTRGAFILFRSVFIQSVQNDFKRIEGLARLSGLLCVPDVASETHTHTHTHTKQKGGRYFSLSLPLSLK